MSSIITSNISDGTTSVPTGYVVNGSAKAWVNFNGTGAIATSDSLNVSSLTDTDVGRYSINFSTAFSNANYCGVASATIGGTNNSNRSSAVGPVSGTSAYCNSWVDNTGSFSDVEVICATVQGDLA